MTHSCPSSPGARPGAAPLQRLLAVLALAAAAALPGSAPAQDGSPPAVAPVAPAPIPVPPPAPADTPPAASPAASPPPASPTPPATPAMPEPGPEENLLAVPEEAAKEGADESADTFGAALLALKLETYWSGLGDVKFQLKPGEEANFEAAINPILGVRLGESVRAELELELEPDDIAVEYALVDVKLHQALTIRSGKFLIPIGHFNEILHPTFRWNMVNRPRMFREVIPAVWSDSGVQARGDFALVRSARVEYAAFVVNGLGAEVDESGVVPAGPEAPEPGLILREARHLPADNNLDKAVGGRLALSLFTGASYGATRIGVSGYTGALNADASRRASIGDVEFGIQLGDVLLRGELAQSFLGPDDDQRAFERGAYGQVAYRIGSFEPALRFDYARTRPTFAEAAVDQKELVPGLMYVPAPYWSLRAESRIDLDEPEPDYSLQLSFYF